MTRVLLLASSVPTVHAPEMSSFTPRLQVPPLCRAGRTPTSASFPPSWPWSRHAAAHCAASQAPQCSSSPNEPTALPAPSRPALPPGCPAVTSSHHPPSAPAGPPRAPSGAPPARDPVHQRGFPAGAVTSPSSCSVALIPSPGAKPPSPLTGQSPPNRARRSCAAPPSSPSPFPTRQPELWKTCVSHVTLWLRLHQQLRVVPKSKSHSGRRALRDWGPLTSSPHPVPLCLQLLAPRLTSGGSTASPCRGLSSASHHFSIHQPASYCPCLENYFLEHSDRVSLPLRSSKLGRASVICPLSNLFLFLPSPTPSK